MQYEYQIKACRDINGSVEWCEPFDAEFFGVYRRPIKKLNQADECWDWEGDFDTHALACGYVKDEQRKAVMDRNDLEERLLIAIRKLMQRNPSLINDIILKGFIGLDEMSDEHLIDFALEYGICPHRE